MNEDTTHTTPTSGAADLLTLIEAYAEARHSHGHIYNAKTAAARKAVKDALAAGQATAAQAGAPANMRLCYSCGHPADAHPWVNDPRGGKRRGDCPAAPAQPAAQQVAAYAALPEKYYLAGGEVPTWDAKQMHAFADATCALRASHGQAPAGATPDCLTCNDHGAVGNILTAEPCPDCTRWNVQPAPATQQAGEAADSVQEDAARWNVWAQVIVEWVNCDTEPKFLRVLSGVLDDAEPPMTLQQLNTWTDAARAAQKERE